MFSNVEVKERRKLEQNSTGLIGETQPNQARQDGVIDCEPGPSQAMDEFEGNAFDNEDENPNMYALQPFKERFQDIALSSLSEKDFKMLGKLLDVERPVGLGRNYVDLGSRLFPDISNDAFSNDLRKRKYPTAYLLQKYIKAKGQQATVYKLVEVLYGMRRLDVIEELLKTFEKRADEKNPKQNNNGQKKRTLLTILKKGLVKDPDSVSGFTVESSVSTLSLDSLSSCQSYESSFTVNGAWQMPEKPNYQARNSSQLGKKLHKKVTDTIFVVSASDEFKFCVSLVNWLRKKGFDATYFMREVLECCSNPYDYVNQMTEDAKQVIIICSPRYKEIVSGGGDCNDWDVYDLSIKQVHNTLCKNFFESGGHNAKYIPLIKPDTSHSCVPSPFSWTMASVFEPNDKEKKKAFCRRLAGEEKYKLGPVGQRPVIKPKLITGNLSDFR